MPELDDILKEDETAKAEEEAQKKASEAKAEEEKKQEDLAVQKKQEQLTNLEKAITEANDELRKVREAKKGEVKEEEIPKIDFTDPSSKAWDKHIKEKVVPLQEEFDKEKSEVFNFSLRNFLGDKPALAADPEKMKEFISTYERIKTNSGRTQEGVAMDLDKAFAAVYHEELMSQARESSVRKAEGLQMFSEPAVSRGATSYFSEKPDLKTQGLTEEDKQIIYKMGYASVEEWAKDKEKYK